MSLIYPSFFIQFYVVTAVKFNCSKVNLSYYTVYGGGIKELCGSIFSELCYFLTTVEEGIYN